jgi:hypothetical protein
LSNGSSSLVPISLSTTLFESYGVFYPSVQWDGEHITVSSIIVNRKVHPARPIFQVYQLSINGSAATVIGTTALKTNGRNFHMGQVSIQNRMLLAPYKNKEQKVGFWPYPKGGATQKAIAVPAEGFNDRLWGLTISVAPRR